MAATDAPTITDGSGDDDDSDQAAESTGMRAPASGPGWREVFLRHGGAGDAPNAAASIHEGHSIVLIASLASVAECLALEGQVDALQRKGCDTRAAEALLCEVDRAAATAVAREVPAASSSRNILMSAPGRLRVPIDEILTAAGQALCDELLLRATALLAGDMPLLMPLLHLSASLAADAESVTGNRSLKFTRGEPAINVYSAGGEFKPHKDLQSLTVLVMLSDPATFAGGGTSFWSQQLKSCAPTEDPDFTLRPPAGTALVFGGGVVHAGHPVESGQRTVFVASFSPHDVTEWGPDGPLYSGEGTGDYKHKRA